MPETIIKKETISSDKDGTLEKVYFEGKARPDGTVSEPWEIRATGRKVQELRGAFKDSAPEMLHQGMKEWSDGGGDLTITRPDGSSDTIRADKEQLYRSMPGFGVARVKVGITVPQMPWHKACGHSKAQNCHCKGEDADG